MASADHRFVALSVERTRARLRAMGRPFALAAVTFALIVGMFGAIANRGATPAPPAPTLAAVQPPVPTGGPVAQPSATPAPCVDALRQVGNASQLLATQLAAVRAPLSEKVFDGWTTLAKVRATNSTRGLYAQAISALEGCPAARKVAARMKVVSTALGMHVGVVLAAGFAAKPAGRAAMVALFRLTREVIAITRDAQKVADRLKLPNEVVASVAGADRPLGRVAALQASSTGLEVRVIDASFFGSGIDLKTYRVEGSSPNAIVRSMSRRGPVNASLGGWAPAMTRGALDVRIGTEPSADGTCSVPAGNGPAIAVRLTVVVPQWSRPKRVSNATIEWWNAVLVDIATHERDHVAAFRSGAQKLNAVMATSACADYHATIDRMWTDLGREQCELTIKEYASVLGVSRDRCAAT